MSEQITVKYYSDFYQYEEYLPYQASEDAAGYDAFAAETKTFLSKSVDSISLEMIWAIPSGFYGKFFPRSGILREHLFAVEAGVIDSDFRGDVKMFFLIITQKKLLLFMVAIELLRLFLWKNLLLVFKE